MPTHTPVRALAISLDSTSTLLPDGTRWSHAAVFGTFYYKGEQLTVDVALLEQFVHNFASGGYPQKPCVDYDHGSTKADPSGDSPKAGDIVELRVVESASALPPSAAQQIQLAGRALSDERNFGLWARWHPTPKAEERIRGREYTEMSIAWADDLVNPRTSKEQGPTLLSIALTNTPHLDTMVPIAATRGEGGSRADSRQERSDMEKVNLLTRLGVAIGRVFSNEEEATSAVEAKISSLTNDVASLQPVKAFATAICTELGASDTVVALAKVKELKTQVATAETAAREAKKVALTAKRDGILKKFEDRYVPAEKPFLETALTADLEAGTDTIEKMLTARPKHSITTRASAKDEGKNMTKNATLDARVKELCRDEKLSYGDALEKAERELADEARESATATV